MTNPDHEPFTLARMAGTPPRRSRWLVPGIIAGAVVLVATTAVVTAAIVGRPAAQPAASASSPAPVAAASTAPPASPSPSATGTAMHKMGEQVTNPRGSKATAFGYRQPVAKGVPKPPQEGFEWGAADVEVCLTVDNGYVNNLPWHLVYADHSTIEASSIGYQQFPEPAFPGGDKDLPNGRCVRGWITYPVPAGKRPVSVEYNPEGFLAEWAVA